MSIITKNPMSVSLFMSACFGNISSFIGSNDLLAFHVPKQLYYQSGEPPTYPFTWQLHALKRNIVAAAALRRPPLGLSRVHAARLWTNWWMATSSCSSEPTIGTRTWSCLHARTTSSTSSTRSKCSLWTRPCRTILGESMCLLQFTRTFVTQREYRVVRHVYWN